jgi:YVTN family beta-propeller protein
VPVLRRVSVSLGVLVSSLVLAIVPNLGAIRVAQSSSGGDVMSLTDEPGRWFRSARTGAPVTEVGVGESVSFEAGDLTDTLHTATLVSRPPASRLVFDQDSPWGGGGGTARFDAPGVYLFLCKVHPYMTGVVAVRDATGSVPPVSSAQLPFIEHLGAASLPAATVLSVLAQVAPDDASKQAKWSLLGATDQLRPAVPGVGEIWVDTQFEAVPGQTDARGVAKPGTITVVDGATAGLTREINGLGTAARGQWNNPHNMWADASLSTVYNTNWHGQWVNKIDRASGTVLGSISVGQAPTHLVSNPNQASATFGDMSLPLSADDKILDLAGLKVVADHASGHGKHPHGQWVTADGRLTVVPNVFNGFGTAGSVAILDTASGADLADIADPAMQLPIAVGIQGNRKAYVANIATGQVSVIDLASRKVLKNIPVTLTPDGQSGAQFDFTHTLQVPIQTPVSPDGRFVAVAVLSLTTVAHAPTGSADHVAIIDTATDSVVKYLGTAPSGHAAGTHGANWGAKLGGGYYAYVTNQYANYLSVIDPDPNGDHSATDADVVGRLLLADGSIGAGVTDGVGGQGVKPFPTAYDGWIQETVALSGTGKLSAEVKRWVAALVPCQRNPDLAGCSTN